MIDKAFQELDSSDVVIGPAHDGGYYLLGMKQLYSPLFIEKKWSTPSVLQDTLKDIKKLALSLRVLPILRDIDVEEDLKKQRLFIGQKQDIKPSR